MPQLHFYVPDDVAAEIRQRAQKEGISTSRYIANLVKRQVRHEWPANFFDEVVGAWQGEPLKRAPQGDYETRTPLATQDGHDVSA